MRSEIGTKSVPSSNFLTVLCPSGAKVGARGSSGSRSLRPLGSVEDVIELPWRLATLFSQSESESELDDDDVDEVEEWE